jgi:hypothetical protein
MAAFYLNGPSLSSATAVFTDSELSTCATDGFYSDGVNVREQVDCVLLPQQVCPSCVSYNCVSGECIDPGDGTGAYSTLEACEFDCGSIITYDLYFADEYTCEGCTLVTTGVTVALPTGTIPQYGKYYGSAFDTNSYLLVSTATVGPGVILGIDSYTTCISSCGV